MAQRLPAGAADVGTRDAEHSARAGVHGSKGAGPVDRHQARAHGSHQPAEEARIALHHDVRIGAGWRGVDLLQCRLAGGDEVSLALLLQPATLF